MAAILVVLTAERGKPGNPLSTRSLSEKVCPYSGLSRFQVSRDIQVSGSSHKVGKTVMETPSDLGMASHAL